MKPSSYDFIKQSIELRLDNIIQLGCKLIMYDHAYHKNTPPTDEEVRNEILSVIKKLNHKKRKSKIKPFAEWTEQDQIAQFTRNRELIRSGEIGGTQNVSYVPADYDVSNPKCLWNLADMCFFIAMLYSGYYYGDEDDIELLQVLEISDTTISEKSHDAIGYWTPKLKKGMSYVNSQGQNSLEIGQYTINIVKDILKKYGGIKGYDKLPRGKGKKTIREEIEKAIIQSKSKADKSKESDVVRNVYKVLKKIRKL
jgi:hypothetical protein